MEYVLMNSILILATLMGEIVVLLVSYPIPSVTFVLVTGIKQIIQLSPLQILVNLKSISFLLLSFQIFQPGCSIAGDGFCDDSTNDGRCDFDGGDCCLPIINDQYCSFCICYANKPEGKLLSFAFL